MGRKQIKQLSEKDVKIVSKERAYWEDVKKMYDYDLERFEKQIKLIKAISDLAQKHIDMEIEKEKSSVVPEMVK